jgi:hypothetical protein
VGTAGHGKPAHVQAFRRLLACKPVAVRRPKSVLALGNVHKIGVVEANAGDREVCSWRANGHRDISENAVVSCSYRRCQVRAHRTVQDAPYNTPDVFGSGREARQ